jgi:hypothetical protein
MRQNSVATWIFDIFAADSQDTSGMPAFSYQRKFFWADAFGGSFSFGRSEAVG